MKSIAPLNDNRIEFGVLIDLTLNNIEYNISNCYKAVTNPNNNKTYTALAGFLDISEIQSNLANATDEIQVSLSAIPSNYLAATLDTQIKGGHIAIYRVFFDYDTQEVITGQIHKRFEGIVSNYSVQENLDVNGQGGDVTHTITIIASSIMGVLENRIAGRRTNKRDFNIVYSELGNTADISMDNVEALFNSSFDFGRPYTAKAASTVNGSGGGANTQQEYQQISDGL